MDQHTQMEIPLLSKGTTVGDMQLTFPQAAAVMQRYGFKAMGCSVAPTETIEKSALVQGLDQQAIEKMISDVNELIKKNPVPEAVAKGTPIALTELAAKHVHQIMEGEGKQGWCLKVGATPGGCSGFQYEMEFVEKASDNDVIVDSQGIKVLFEKKAENVLRGITIDFREALNGAGFVMQNPNATASCGCGSSFQV